MTDDIKRCRRLVAGIVLSSIISVPFLMALAGAATVGPEISNDFTWKIANEDDPASAWVRLDFTDGRIITVRVPAIVSTEYYPADVASVFGFPSAALKINYPGGSVRLNVESESGKAFVKKATQLTKS